MRMSMKWRGGGGGVGDIMESRPDDDDACNTQFEVYIML